MKKIIIVNKTGIHARPASLLIKAAQAFDSEIYLIKQGTESNCKSIMNILSMGICYNDEISIRAVGSDSEAAEQRILSILEAINAE